MGGLARKLKKQLTCFPVNRRIRHGKFDHDLVGLTVSEMLQEQEGEREEGRERGRGRRSQERKRKQRKDLGSKHVKRE